MSEKKIYTVFCQECCNTKDVYLSKLQAETKCAEMNVVDKQKKFIHANKDLIVSRLSEGPLSILIAPFLRNEMTDFQYQNRYTVIENTFV